MADAPQHEPGDGDVFEIGREFADALAAESRHRAAAARGSPLEGVAYSGASGEHDLLRYVPSDLDAVVSGFVAGFCSSTEQGRGDLRSRLTLDDFYTLITFGRRRCVAALRAADPAIAREALDAASVVDPERIDWRDLVVVAGVAAYVVRRLGGDAGAWIDAAAARAAAEARDVLLRFRHPSPDDADIASWGMAVVDVGSGPCFADVGLEPYAPTVELMGPVMRVISLLEGDGDYRVGSVTLGTPVAPVWLPGASAEEARIVLSRILGCITVGGHLSEERGPDAASQQLTAFLLEAGNETDAAALQGWAGAGPADHAAVTARAGAVLCIVIARSFVMGVDPYETTDSISRFADGLARALDERGPS